MSGNERIWLWWCSTHNDDEHNEGKDNDNDDDTYEIPNVNISN